MLPTSRRLLADQLDAPEQCAMFFRNLCQPNSLLKVVAQARVVGFQNIDGEVASHFGFNAILFLPAYLLAASVKRSPTERATT